MPVAGFLTVNGPIDAHGFLCLHDVEPTRFRLLSRMLDLLSGDSQVTTQFLFHFPQPAGDPRVGVSIRRTQR